MSIRRNNDVLLIRAALLLGIVDVVVRRRLLPDGSNKNFSPRTNSVRYVANFDPFASALTALGDVIDDLIVLPTDGAGVFCNFVFVDL